ncbi:MAG: bifunctional diaminohydroxyphosphoribosylaminopyrimidine deaminase/5-amino-6-(5-phosphoribosylamino)uracil reductase RibD [Thermodesulfobacteriota bacterium]
MARPEAADAAFMRLALAEARKGLGRTAPNPAVGAVVVAGGQVVGRGFHRRAGTPHAEVHALAAAGARARGATLYVTLEPCHHTGRTPPCTGAVLAAGIRRLVVGAQDPNPTVIGGGAAFLAKQGIEVVSGVLAGPCQELIAPFAKHVATGLPWVVLKAGMTLDGRIATACGHSQWITGERARREVHRLRDRLDAVLVGIGTALADDPQLTCRLPRGRDPLRVVLDSQARLPATCRMLTQGSAAATWLFCGPEAPEERRVALAQAGCRVVTVPRTAGGGLDLASVLGELGRAGITSLLVEGGSRVHGAFLAAGLADRCLFFVAPRLLGGDGLPVVAGFAARRVEDGLALRDVTIRHCGADFLVSGTPVRSRQP